MSAVYNPENQQCTAAMATAVLAWQPGLLALHRRRQSRDDRASENQELYKVRAMAAPAKIQAALDVRKASMILVASLLSHNFACDFGAFGASLRHHATRGPAETFHIGNLAFGECVTPAGEARFCSKTGQHWTEASKLETTGGAWWAPLYKTTPSPTFLEDLIMSALGLPSALPPAHERACL